MPIIGPWNYGRYPQAINAKYINMEEQIMDKLYIVYGRDYITFTMGDTEGDIFGLFKTREEAEDYAIQRAHTSFNTFNEKEPQCRYNNGNLVWICGEEDYYTKPTEIGIEELTFIKAKPNEILDKTGETTVWITFGTLDREDCPEHYPLPMAFENPREASSYMLMEAYKNFIKFDTPTEDIMFYTNKFGGEDLVNKIFDGEDWMVELRLVPLGIDKEK